MRHTAGFLFIYFAFGSPAVAQPQILNGGFDGGTGFNTVPGPWEIVSRTPDTLPPGGISPFAPDMPASPEGGNFVHAQAELPGVGASPVAGFAEAFQQTVTGLTVGVQYEISFWQANAGAFAGNEDRFDPGAWDVLFGAQVQRSPTTAAWQGQGLQFWEPVSLAFTASAPNQTLRFTAVDLPGVDSTTLPASGFGGVGLALDGVSIAVVPAPGTAALLLGSSMLATRRRRS